MPAEAIDRRAFLTVAGAAGLAAVAGCGGGSAPAAKTRRLPAPARPRSSRPAPRHLRDAIRGQVLERGSPGFADAARVYNLRFESVLPDAIARPVDARDVAAAVDWAVTHGVPVRARSGGHSYAGYSTLEHGVVIDVRRLRAIDVDRREGVAHVGAGAQLIDVYGALAARGATIPAGSCPSVGIAGMAMGGGMGLAGRAFGLTVDHLIGAEIVTADGALREVDLRHDPDLLWALRGGGGGNFGVVTRFTFRVRPLPAQASYFFVSWPFASADEVLSTWLGWAPGADQRLTSILHLQSAAASTTVSLAGQYLGPPGDLAAGLLSPILAVGGAGLTVGSEPYLALQRRWAGCLGIGAAACHTAGTFPGDALPRASFYARSDYLRSPLSAGGRATLIEGISARAGLSGSGAFLLDSYGGAINRVAPDATAFVHRHELCSIQYLSYGGGEGWLDQTYARMRPYVSGMAYQNYIDASLPGWREAYYGSNLPRLEAIRKHVDPERFFRFPQGI